MCNVRERERRHMKREDVNITDTIIKPQEIVRKESEDSYESIGDF